MDDDCLGGPTHRENSGQGFITGLEPLIEHSGLEQRSREVGQDESRVRFAREEPLAHERKGVGFIGHGRSRATRNPMTLQQSQGDVL